MQSGMGTAWDAKSSKILFLLPSKVRRYMTMISREQLLAEIEDVIRTMPPRPSFRHETAENLSWLGRASAAIEMWNPIKAAMFGIHVQQLHATMAAEAVKGINGIIVMLHQAQHDLRLRTVGPLTVAVNQGSVFDYFDEVRKVIEAAKIDLLFVDPYLDAEFVSRYLPHVSQGVAVRLLARERLSTLLPAVALLRQQTGLSIEVRAAGAFHDRYVFVDNLACYQSGASFKDGARKAPTTLTQIVDAFGAVMGAYEQIWTSATVQK
jgi:hypothetical protein